MHIPSNEGKACDAIVRLLEKRTGKTRSDIRFPEKDCTGPPVELRLRLGTQEYAIEHTRIEAFEEQIKTDVVFQKISRHITRELSGTLPKPACYRLRLPIDVSLQTKPAQRDRAWKEFYGWIRAQAQCLQIRNPIKSIPAYNPHKSDDSIHGTPPGFTYTITLDRWPNAAALGREQGSLHVVRVVENDMEAHRVERLRRALSDKCPKLEGCQVEGARTVLVLESDDIALSNHIDIGNALIMAIDTCESIPDEIYLVETENNPWWVWLMKLDCLCWPTEVIVAQDPVGFQDSELLYLTDSKDSAKQ